MFRKPKKKSIFRKTQNVYIYSRQDLSFQKFNFNKLGFLFSPSLVIFFKTINKRINI